MLAGAARGVGDLATAEREYRTVLACAEQVG
jgi:hypothetical protein